MTKIKDKITGEWKDVANLTRSNLIRKRKSMSVSVASTPGYAQYNIVWPEAFPDDTYLVDFRLSSEPHWAAVTSKILAKTATGVSIGLGMTAQGVTYTGTLTIDAVW